MQRTLTVRSWMVLLLVMGLCVGTTNAFAVISGISVSLDGPEQGWPNEALEYTATGSYTLDSGTQDEIDDNEASVTEEWEWTYAPASCSTPPADSNEETFTYAPAQAGTDQQIIVTYTVTVTFSDESQVSASRWATKFVHVKALIVSMAHPARNPFTADIGTPTYFKARAEDSTGQLLTSQCTWEWDFGDAVGAAQSAASQPTARTARDCEPGDQGDPTQNPTYHAYTEEDDYTVTVTATYEGLSAEDETEVDAQELGGGGANGGWTVDVVFDPDDPGGTKAGGTVCDTVYFVLDNDLDDDGFDDCVIPYLEIYKWDQAAGEYTGLDDIGGYNPSNPYGWMAPIGGDRDPIPWDTLEDKNTQQQFLVKAWVEGDWDPELMEFEVHLEYAVISHTPDNTVVRSAYTVVKHDGGAFSHVAWAIEHLDHDDPRFNITVNIYGLSSGAQEATVYLTNQDLSTGSIPGASQPDLPEGLYTYKVHTNHDQGAPGCLDTDKVDILEIDSVTLDDFDVPTLTMTVTVGYTVGQAISGGKLEVFDEDLNQIAMAAVAATPGEGSCTFLIPVQPEQGGEVFSVILSGTQADGSANRDLQPKPAVQKSGSVMVPWPRSQNWRGSDWAWGTMLADWQGTEHDGRRYAAGASASLPTDDEVEEALVSDALVLIENHGWDGHICIADGGDVMGNHPTAYDPHSHLHVFLADFAGQCPHLLFVNYVGCRTARTDPLLGNLLDASKLAGADIAAGFKEQVWTGPSGVWVNRFYFNACYLGDSLFQAQQAACQAVRDAYGGNARGYDSYFITPWQKTGRGDRAGQVG